MFAFLLSLVSSILVLLGSAAFFLFCLLQFGHLNSRLPH